MKVKASMNCHLSLGRHCSARFCHEVHTLLATLSGLRISAVLTLLDATLYTDESLFKTGLDTEK